MTAQTQPLPRLHEFADVVAQIPNMSLRMLRERACARKFAHVLIGRKRYLTDEQLASLIAALTVEREAAAAKPSQREIDLAKVTERQSRRKAKQQRPAA